MLLILRRVDHSRIQTVGPDRAAAEWILRLGGSVKFRGLDHWNSSYNHLPSGILHLHAIDATGLAITSNGLEHLGGYYQIVAIPGNVYIQHSEGLAHLQELSLSKCKYLYNDGIALIRHVQKTILYLDLSDCAALTGHCLHHLGSLK